MVYYVGKGLSNDMSRFFQDWWWNTILARWPRTPQGHWALRHVKALHVSNEVWRKLVSQKIFKMLTLKHYFLDFSMVEYLICQPLPISCVSFDLISFNTLPITGTSHQNVNFRWMPLQSLYFFFKFFKLRGNLCSTQVPQQNSPIYRTTSQNMPAKKTLSLILIVQYYQSL